MPISDDCSSGRNGAGDEAERGTLRVPSEAENRGWVDPIDWSYG
ncbi:hypothetical protein [Haladaptatus sp. CMAA 1911]